MDPKDFTFESLGGGKYRPSLAYIVALIEPGSDSFRDAGTDWVLAAQYDFEEQAQSPTDLLKGERLHMPNGVFPQTPVILTRGWSPLASVLERGLEPTFIRRRERAGDLAVGIWMPHILGDSKDIESCGTDKELFSAIFDKVSAKAIERGLAVCILAKAGWNYEDAIGSLPRWSAKEVMQADRVLWKRTPDG